MNRYANLVGAFADRFRWWANPPMPVRPTPALDGWTLDEWIAAAGIVAPSSYERFNVQFPGRIPCGSYDVRALAREALRKLLLEDEVDTVPGRADCWRARAKLRTPG